MNTNMLDSGAWPQEYIHVYTIIGQMNFPSIRTHAIQNSLQSDWPLGI